MELSICMKCCVDIIRLVGGRWVDIIRLMGGWWVDTIRVMGGRWVDNETGNVAKIASAAAEKKSLIICHSFYGFIFILRLCLHFTAESLSESPPSRYMMSTNGLRGVHPIRV